MDSTNKRTIRRAFEQAAAGYDAAAFLQQEVARRLDERLQWMRIDPATLLDAGCGTGHAFPLLRARYPQARLLGLDIAHGMLQQARRQLPPPPLRQRLAAAIHLSPQSSALSPLLCADLEHLPLRRDGVDLVWSNLALQWMQDPEAAFREVHRVLRPGGLFAFSSFGPDTLGELREAFRGLDGYGHVNRFLDMHDLGDLLVYAGFAHPVMEMERITLTYADLKDLLRELKAIGAQTVTEGRRNGLMGRREWRALLGNYERFRKEGRLPATFEVVYGHAWTGNKDRLEDGRQVIRMQIAEKRAGGS